MERGCETNNHSNTVTLAYAPPISPSQRLVAALAFAAFVSLGLPDGVLGIAWPSVRHAFNLPVSRLGVILTAGVCGSLVSSFLSGQIVRTIGVGPLLLVSSIIVVLGLTCTALSPAWHFVVAGALLGGLGAGAIDAGINSFAAERFSPRVVTWLHACYGVGATTGPLLMTLCLTLGAGWRVGYGVIASLMTVMACLFAFALPLWGSAHMQGPHVEPDADIVIAPATAFEALRRPAVWMNVVLFFLYTGTEVTAGQWLYSLLTEARGYATGVAGAIVGGYWGSLTLGRVVFGQLAHRFGAGAMLRVATIAAPLAAMLIWRPPTPGLDAFGAAVLGFSLAPIYPLLVSVTPQRVGRRFAAQSIGFQVSAATIGVATVPGLAGILARERGLETVPGYIFAATVLLLVLQEAGVKRCRTTSSTS